MFPAKQQRTVWAENSPETLLKLTTRFCLKQPRVFTDQLPCGSLKLKDGLYLPLEISEALFTVCQEERIDIDDNFTNIFADFLYTRLGHLAISNCSLSDQGMRCLLGHGLKVISINNCLKLSTNSLEFINDNSDSLMSLHVENCYQIFPDYLSSISQDSEDEFDDENTDEFTESMYEKRHYILKAPRLKNLCIKDLYVAQGRNYFNVLMKALPNLSHLDLSGLMHSQGLNRLIFLLNCPNLISLILHNVKEVKSSLSTLCQMKKVEHLDISQFDELYGDFESPTSYLSELVSSLPALRSLDISGTNLASDYTKLGGRSDGKVCDIPGLAGRIEQPLEFLGLYRTHQEEASRRTHIPARHVAGSASEEQILLAGRRYHDRPLVLENVLDDLMMLIRQETCRDLEQVVDITVLTMERYCKETKIQRYASAILYYLLNPVTEQPATAAKFNCRVKGRVLGALLDTMREHRQDPILLRNGCMVLWQFKVPGDLLPLYERVVDTLLYIVENHREQEESYVQRAAVHLLNSLVCRVEGPEKSVMGRVIIDTMLAVVQHKLDISLCDEVLETAWSVMWNVTDETPGNSKRFLDQHGMELFLRCKETFPHKLDLLKNMMGLLGNVAEVRTCRRRLMTADFVEEFSFLLDSQSDGIEVSYNAAGVLSHMASDGPAAWTIQHPSREHVLERLARAVNRWDIKTRRNINYRSLGPIIGLLEAEHTVECQLWATWALANLTNFDEDKYCPLVEEEGGLGRIRANIEMIMSRLASGEWGEQRGQEERLLNLSQRAVSNIEAWNKRHSSEYLGTNGLCP